MVHPAGREQVPCPVSTFQSFRKLFETADASKDAGIGGGVVFSTQRLQGPFTWGRWESNPVPGTESNTFHHYTTLPYPADAFIQIASRRLTPTHSHTVGGVHRAGATAGLVGSSRGDRRRLAQGTPRHSA
ncbi:unnamed protein product [Boreogadus saida]